MSKSLRVLSIEDSERDAILIHRHLSAAGYIVVNERVDTADAVRAALAEKPWDIILCDYSMPDFGALPALSILKESGLDLPFIIISGTVGEDIAVEAMLTGANDYLAKDNLKRLIPAIERELHEAENRRAQRQAEKERKVIFEIIQGIITMSDLRKFLTHAHQSIRQILYAENCFVMLHDRESGRVHFELWVDKHDPPPELPQADKGFAGYVLRTGKPLLVTEETSQKMRERGEVELIGTSPASWAGVPLRTASLTIGVLAVQHYEDEHAYTPRDLEFLSSVGDQIALAIERKRAEEALRESEARYRMLFDYAPYGIVITDPEGSYLDANSSICRMLGLTHDQIVRLNAADVVVDDEVGRLESALDEINYKTVHHQEWRFRCNGGRDFSAEVIASKMPDDTVLGMIRDVTERRNAEREKAQLMAEVKSQSERLDNIVANVPGIVWETSRGAELSEGFVSDYVTVMLGYSVEEWFSIPEFWFTKVDPEHQGRVEAAFAAAFARGESCVLEFPVIAKDGRRVWVEAQSAVIFDAEGNPSGVRGVTIDVTERKRSEEALRQSEERYRDLVENAIDIIYVHDLAGNYTSVNKAVEKITGYSQNEILSKNMGETLAPEYLGKAKNMMAAKLAGKDFTAYEVEIIAKDGRRIAVEVNSRLMYEDGKPVGIQGIARDTTERKHLEDKFRQSQKMEAIGLLAGGIAHDFNNLLTAITGYSEITLAKMTPDNPLRRNVEEIKDAGERATALTGQLLAFSRKQILKPVVHNLNSVLANIENMLRRLIKENIEFSILLDPDLGNIEADPGQLEQVIMNLAINAQDAMPDGGILTITTESVFLNEISEGHNLKVDPGPFVKMTVTDTGEGIDEQIQWRIFEPFFTTKVSGKGSGLGLSTVHGIVKQSGGDIIVRSEKGRGSTFEIYLPSAGEFQDALLGEGSKTGDYTGTETVLLVEDDKAVRGLVRKILTAKGYEVLEAATGEMALAICRERPGPIHLLLTDLVMPKMSGSELTNEVKHLRPEVKSLVMTGYTEDAAATASLLASQTVIIEKPFTPEALARKVREALDSGKLSVGHGKST